MQNCIGLLQLVHGEEGAHLLRYALDDVGMTTLQNGIGGMRRIVRAVNAGGKGVRRDELGDEICNADVLLLRSGFDDDLCRALQHASVLHVTRHSILHIQQEEHLRQVHNAIIVLPLVEMAKEHAQLLAVREVEAHPPCP